MGRVAGIWLNRRQPASGKMSLRSSHVLSRPQSGLVKDQFIKDPSDGDMGRHRDREASLDQARWATFIGIARKRSLSLAMERPHSVEQMSH